MDYIREYIFSVAVISVLCSIILRLMQNLQIKNIGKMVCGLALSVSIIGQLSKFDNLDINNYLSYSTEDAEEAVALGEELSYEAWSDIIKLETEAYILDKAADLNAEVSVSVTVREDPAPAPVSADISGSISPYARNRLEKIMEEELGITKENQQWTG